MSFNEFNYTLFLNIRNGNTSEFIQSFEQNHVDCNTNLNNFDWTPLHTAAYHGNTELVAYLLGRGADKNLKNKSGYTPQMLAQSKGFDELSNYIREATKSTY